MCSEPETQITEMLKRALQFYDIKAGWGQSNLIS